VTNLVSSKAFSDMSSSFTNKATGGVGVAPRKTKKGGYSIASDAVTNLVSSKAFSDMNNAFTNKAVSSGGVALRKAKKGGYSVASDAVTNLVSSKAFSDMNNAFTNKAVSSGSGGVAPRKTKNGGYSPNATTKGNIWNRVIDDFSQNFMGGGEFKNMSHYMGKDFGANITNKKGGDPATPVGLNYSDITSAKLSGYPFQNVSSSQKTMDVLTDSSIMGDFVPDMSKVVQYGNLSEQANNHSSPFSFGGIFGGNKTKVGKTRGGANKINKRK
jgi:hypothetical protein